MVPWLAAASPSAPRMTSVTRCEVSTLPPTTAGASAGSSLDGGSRTERGMRTSSGASTPSLSGMSSSIRQRKQ